MSDRNKDRIKLTGRTRAAEAAVAVATAYGLQVDEPVVIRDGSNVLIRLDPYPVLARVAVMIGELRPDGGLAWLEREVALAQHLTKVHAPAVPVSPLLPPGPHIHDSLGVTFMTWLDHHPEQPLSGAALGNSLRHLHEGLRSYPGQLPKLTMLFEVQGWLDTLKAEQILPVDDRQMLEVAYARARDTALALDLPYQALHGDAHRDNILHTPEGPIWTDFEDVCRGPVHWDLAGLVASSRMLGSDVERMNEALSAYGIDPHDPVLDAWIEARAVAIAAWSVLTAGKHPEKWPRAKARLDWVRTRT